MGNKYVVESQFEDLHGNPAEETDLELDLSKEDNPIIQAALDGSDEDWTPPDDDDKEETEDKDDDEDEEEDDDSEEDEDDEEDDSEDDDSDEDEDDDSDEEEDDDGDYSKNVRKRIDRERQRAERAEKRADAKVRRLERKMELRDAKDELRDEERKAESKLRKLRKQKVDALEEGDTEKAVDLDEDILDIKSDLKEAKAKVKTLEDNIDNDDVDEGDNIPDAGRKWIGRYPEFHTNDAFKDVVLSADRMVARRGFDKNTDKYYAEIEKIVAVQFPEIVKKRAVKVRNKNDKRGRRKKPAVGGTQRAGTRKVKKGRRGKVIRLTKADQEQMITFGLDPKNPTHAKEWAANKS